MRFFVSSFVSAALLLAVAPAHAGPKARAESDVIDGLTLEITGHAVWIDAPEVEGLGTVATDATDVVSGGFDDDEGVEGWGGGVDVRLGFDLPFAGDDTPWNVELGGSFARVEQGHRETLSAFGGTFIAGIPINFASDVFGILGANQNVEQRFDGKVEIWDVRLGLAHEIELDEWVQARARIGVVAGMIEQDYDIRHSATSQAIFGLTPFHQGDHLLREELEDYFVGPYIGFDVEAQLTARLSASLDVELALLYHQAVLEADQQFHAVMTDFMAGVCPPPFCQNEFEETDREASFGMRPRVSASLEYDLGSFILGLNGGLTWWSYAPQVVNPQVESINPQVGRGEAHISGDDMFVADVGLQVTVPFGRTSTHGGPYAPSLIDGLYLETTGHAVFVDAPDVEGLGVANISVGAIQPVLMSPIRDEADVSTFGGGFDLRAGFAVTDDHTWYAELGGSYAKAEEEDSDTFFGSEAPGFYTPVPIDGLAAIGYLSTEGGPNDTRQRFDGEVEVWDARIGVARDLELPGGFRARARAGIVGGILEQSYEMEHEVTTFNFAPPFLAGRHDLDEDLESWFLGPYFGIEIDEQLLSWISVNLDFDLALLYNDAELEADQRWIAPTFDDTGFICEFGSPALGCSFHADENDRDTRFGVRPRVRAGVDFDLGTFILGVHGGVTYWSYAPQVVNPQLESGPPGNRFIGFDEAHIGQDDMLTADVGVKVTIPFGR